MFVRGGIMREARVWVLSGSGSGGVWRNRKRSAGGCRIGAGMALCCLNKCSCSLALACEFSPSYLALLVQSIEFIPLEDHESREQEQLLSQALNPSLVHVRASNTNT
jgi:hypothetical protein